MTDPLPPSVDNSTQEKKWLLQICAGCIFGLIVLGILAVTHGVDATGATILGVIVGALATFGKDIVAAVRSYSMAASLQRVTDQVAAAAPAATPDSPLPVTVTNKPGEPVPVANEGKAA